MMTFWLNLAVPVATSVLGAFLAVQLALRRFYKEKWWEKKLETYISALESLHRFRFIFAEWQDIFLTRRKPSDDEKRDLEKRRLESELDLRRIIDVGVFLVTAEAVEALEVFWLGMFRALARGEDPVDDYGECCDLADEALAKLRRIAKSDLGLHPRFARSP